MKKDTKISEESCIIKNIKAVWNGRSIFNTFYNSYDIIG